MADTIGLEECKNRLEELEKAREELLKLARELRINATKTIAAIHSGENYQEYLDNALKILNEVVEYRKYPEIYYSISHDAMQEFVEALALVKFVRKERILEFDIPAEPSSIVTGLADVIGELRRYALTKLVKGEFDEAKRAMDQMEEIYNKLIPFVALPDKLVPGLRHKLDVGRAAIERTKSDYLAAKVAKRLSEV